MRTELRFDAASAIDKGQRCYQEDALKSSFEEDGKAGLVILSDGMGGHAAGDVASQIVVEELYRQLVNDPEDSVHTAGEVGSQLRAAAQAANHCLKKHVAGHPDANGMGATMLTALVARDALYWISVGDSPLFLYRDGRLRQLNEDHSLAPQIDFLVETGVLTPEQARAHPNRNVLTSALNGTDIPRIDCPQKPMPLQHNDTLIVASDGLLSLSKSEIADVLHQLKDEPSARMTHELMSRVLALGDTNQDNVSVAIINARQHATHRLDFVADHSGRHLAGGEQRCEERSTPSHF